MCPKVASTTTPNRIAASAPRLGTRRGLRSSGWTRLLRLRVCISTNTYSRWLLFSDRRAGLSPGNRRASGNDLAALIAWPADPADGLRLARPAPGMAAVRPGRPEQTGTLAHYRPEGGERACTNPPDDIAARYVEDL